MIFRRLLALLAGVALARGALALAGCTGIDPTPPDWHAKPSSNPQDTAVLDGGGDAP